MHDTSPHIDTLTLAEALIAAPSVTPATGAVFDVLDSALAAAGFTVERFVDGEAPDGPVENLLAIRRNGAGPHVAFAGHLDVVPPGDEWTNDPFTPTRAGGLLYGRGAVDMKGSIAAFAVAAAQESALPGTVSFLITGDEEGAATYGTPVLMQHMAARGVVPDLCLVGEPTSANRLGDVVKIGRRGSVNMWIAVEGVQGHVAYPHLADNPAPRLLRILTAIDAIVLDEGTDWFQPSNIEITDIHIGNPSTNTIPARATARISIRFNDQHSGASLTEIIRTIVEREQGGSLVAKISGEPFLTQPGALSVAIRDAIHAVTGMEPEFSTTGGTSDARFLCKLCPVVEFGLNNATMHKRDEAVAIADLDTLTAIYADFLRRTLGAA
ncbi:succinyl-diaminopimelate desuccinylase [Sphingobium sufflavum]|uniref:succinyl-diaminopimelate desuccinylase n=1 Tax=Sphingobium sufflavum TaxID=1129547 RepID=UPI001F382DDC|nr:succinyl-diaminopimelate desuccinylase [Sphingobium sufflavum]MCE7798595.1 succinyl-diaminopimelate desuccinylase [Sphingobium sufflavum]